MVGLIEIIIIVAGNPCCHRSRYSCRQKLCSADYKTQKIIIKSQSQSVCEHMTAITRDFLDHALERQFIFQGDEIQALWLKNITG